VDSGIPKTRWARTIDGASIAYQAFGHGNLDLLVVHSWCSHIEVFWEQPRFRRFMDRLSRNLRVIHLDKRGMGMSDRVIGAPDVGVLMDDLRAVMDAAGVERAVVFGWGASDAGPLAALFAATYPERTIALILDGALHRRKDADCPWGITDEEAAREDEDFAAVWGDDEYASEQVKMCYGERLEDAPHDDPQFCRWWSKMQRFSATPTGQASFSRMWFQTDIRPTLATIHVPTAVLCKTLAESAPDDYIDQRSWATFNLQHIPGARLIEIPGTAHVVWVEEPEPYVSALEEFVASVGDEEAELDRVLATVLFTDIVCSTKMAADLGDHEWKVLLDRHHSTVRSLLARYRGDEVKTLGDGFLATFDSPARAVHCAAGICQAVRPLGMEVRVGCHTGEIEVMDNDVGGLAVHIAARVAAKAKPSEVLVSSTVKDLVAGSALSFVDRGSHALKGVPGRWRLFACNCGDTDLASH